MNSPNFYKEMVYPMSEMMIFDSISFLTDAVAHCEVYTIQHYVIKFVSD